LKIGLLLVDIQNDYFHGGRMELVGIDEASSRAKDLLLLFRENQWPIFHIQHIAAGSDATFFLPDTVGVDIHESVKSLPNESVITKHHPNSFRKTLLLEELSKAAVKRVVICGAMSHMCIDATTRAAADLGFDCFVIHNGCATKNLQFGIETILAKKVHASFMAALGSAYARVLSSKEFLSISKIELTT